MKGTAGSREAVGGTAGSREAVEGTAGSREAVGGTAGSTKAVWRQNTTCLPASTPSTKPTMARLPILLLSLSHGIAAQAQQTVDQAARLELALNDIRNDVLARNNVLVDNNMYTNVMIIIKLY